MEELRTANRGSIETSGNERYFLELRQLPFSSDFYTILASYSLIKRAGHSAPSCNHRELQGLSHALGAWMLPGR